VERKDIIIKGRREDVSMTDPLADMLTRIRNASMARHEKVDIPSSNIKTSIAKVLKNEGYIKNYKVIKDNKQGILRIYLKYGLKNEPVIEGIKRVSKPGRRVYSPYNKIPRVRSGYGVMILSTSKGILTDREARKLKVGGELLCAVW
jgi:small subunit ribosomal protein S8